MSFLWRNYFYLRYVMQIVLEFLLLVVAIFPISTLSLSDTFSPLEILIGRLELLQSLHLILQLVNSVSQSLRIGLYLSHKLLHIPIHRILKHLETLVVLFLDFMDRYFFLHLGLGNA